MIVGQSYVFVLVNEGPTHGVTGKAWAHSFTDKDKVVNRVPRMRSYAETSKSLYESMSLWWSQHERICAETRSNVQMNE